MRVFFSYFIAFYKGLIKSLWNPDPHTLHDPQHQRYRLWCGYCHALQPVKNSKIVKSNRHKYFIAFADDNPLVHVRIIIIIHWSCTHRWLPPSTNPTVFSLATKWLRYIDTIVIIMMNMCLLCADKSKKSAPNDNRRLTYMTYIWQVLLTNSQNDWMRSTKCY